MRDRLIELINEAEKQDGINAVFGDIDSIIDAPRGAEFIADYLLANGVIVPPCKVGDTVWFNTYKKNATVCVGIQPHTVDRVDVNYVCDTKNLIETNLRSWEIGKTVFLTREEAERALKGGGAE